MNFPWGANQSAVIKEKGRQAKINVSLPVTIIKREDYWVDAMKTMDLAFNSKYPEDAIKALAMLIYDAARNGYFFLVGTTKIRKTLFVFANLGVKSKIGDVDAEKMAMEILGNEKEDDDFVYKLCAKRGNEVVKRGKGLPERIADAVLKEEKDNILAVRLVKEFREGRIREAKLTAQKVLSDPNIKTVGWNLAKIVQYM